MGYEAEREDLTRAGALGLDRRRRAGRQWTESLLSFNTLKSAFITLTGLIHGPSQLCYWHAMPFHALTVSPVYWLDPISPVLGTLCHSILSTVSQIYWLDPVSSVIGRTPASSSLPKRYRRRPVLLHIIGLMLYTIPGLTAQHCTYISLYFMENSTPI